MRVLRLVGLGIATIFFASSVASADFIDYKAEAVISGMAFNIPFFDGTASLDFTADRSHATVDIITGVTRNVAMTATVTVSGVGTATFTSPIDVFVNPSSSTPMAGFGVNGGATILATLSPAFESDSLITSPSIGPITGASMISAGMSFGTTMGNIIINSAGDSTFSALPVPEPASLLLLGTGLIGIGARRWRNRRQRG